MSDTSMTALPFDDGERLIDMKAIQQLLGFKSRTAVDDAEARRAIPPSFKISGSRRWRLSAVRKALADIEAGASVKTSKRFTADVWLKSTLHNPILSAPLPLDGPRLETLQ